IKASNTLRTQVEIQNPPLSSSEIKEIENTGSESARVFLPGEPLQMENTQKETTGHCSVETEAPEKIILAVHRP
ncbi:hypothetical protein ACKYVA_22255, partial [Paenibacillus larvae]